LVTILNILGKQDSRDTSFLKNNKEYFKLCESENEKVNFSLEFEESSQDLIILLESML